MKKLAITAALALIASACQPPAPSVNKELEEKIEKLEKAVEELKKGAAPAQRPPQPEQTAAYSIPVGESAILGNPNAKINVSVFTDYQCPFCARVDPMLHEVIKDPELKDKVNVVFKHFPLSFHKDAKPASKAALAAKEQGNENFWKMSEKLYANQRELTPENFSKWAKEIGIDVKKFEADLKNNDAKYEALIAEDMKVGQTSAKVRGTPSIFVGGWELKQRSVDGVKDIIKEKNLGS
jgi:protein-disulfide isomerase